MFQLHLIRDELFQRLDGVPICEISQEVVKQLQEQVQQVAAPSSPIKRAEFEQQKTESQAILEGLSDESLRTVISFRIATTVDARLHIPVKKAIQSDANKPPIPAPTLPVIPIQKRQPALLHNTPKP